jgi:hypothetical protein
MPSAFFAFFRFDFFFPAVGTEVPLLPGLWLLLLFLLFVVGLLFGFGECCSAAVTVIVVEVSVVVEEVGGRTGKIVGGEKGLTVVGLGLEKKNGKQPAIEKKKMRNNGKEIFSNVRKRRK